MKRCVCIIVESFVLLLAVYGGFDLCYRGYEEYVTRQIFPVSSDQEAKSLRACSLFTVSRWLGGPQVKSTDKLIGISAEPSGDARLLKVIVYVDCGGKTETFPYEVKDLSCIGANHGRLHFKVLDPANQIAQR